MRKFLSLLFMMSCVYITLIAQDTEERPLPHFNKIRSGTSFDVFIRKGNTENVVIEAQSGDISKIITEVKGDVLNISVENPGSWSWWNNSNNFRGVKLYVTFRDVTEVVGSGSGAVRLESSLNGENLKIASSGSGNFFCEGELNSQGDIRISNSGSGSLHINSEVSAQDEVNINNSGSGNISIERLNARNLKLENSGSGDTKINDGEVNNQYLVTSGSGSLHMGQTSNTCEVRKSGSGAVHVDVRSELTGNSSGSGNIYVSGNSARTNVNISGSGRVKQVN